MQKEGIVIKAVAGVFDVFCEGEVLSAYAAGRFRNEKLKLLVGDKVKLELAQNGDKNFICDVLDRKNQIARPTVANVDTLLITLAVKKPNPDLMLVDQLICWCRKIDIEPVVCVNKSDYSLEDAIQIAEQYKKSNIRVFITSKEDAQSILTLKQSLSEGITCFCGQSAVGKSSLMNQLLGRETFEIGGLSKRTERGKNTTRHCELVEFDKNKFLADTPGFSLLEMPMLSPEEFTSLYFEYEPFAEDCRFIGCAHVNEPNCAVKQAIEENILSKERYERYKELFLQTTERWKKRYD